MGAAAFAVALAAVGALPDAAFDALAAIGALSAAELDALAATDALPAVALGALAATDALPPLTLDALAAIGPVRTFFATSLALPAAVTARPVTGCLAMNAGIASPGATASADGIGASGACAPPGAG